MRPIEFVPSTFPHGDFLLATGTYRVGTKSAAIGLREEQLSAQSAILHLPEAAPSWTQGLAFGVWRQRDVLRCGVTALEPGELSPSGRLDAIGQYSALALNAHGENTPIVVSADEFGMVPIYYFTSASGCLVSNRIHLILVALSGHADSIVVNFPALYARCFVDKSICMQTTTQETIYDGIRMTLPWQYIEVSDRGLRIRGEKPEHTAVSLAEYNDLILQGAEEVRSNIDAALSCDAFPRVVSTLTGGRDSRVIFAALVSLGQTGAIPFQTQPLDNADVNVATALVQAFGGNFDTVPSAPEEPPDQYAHLVAHRSVFMGQYSELRKVPVTVPSPALRLVGGCGETYRSFYSKQYSYDLVQRAFDREAVRDFLRAHSFWKLYAPSIFDDVEEILFRNLAELRGDTLSEKLEEHYFAFRNRFHFGVAGSHRHPAAPVYQPLVSPSLLRASRGVPLDVRLSGRIIYDVTAALSADVAHFPYAGKPLADFSAVPFHVDRSRGASLKSFEPRPDLLTAASLAKRASSTYFPARVRTRGTPAFEQAIDSTLPLLRELDGFSQIVTDKLASRIMWLKSVKSKFHRVWGSRISAMGDAVYFTSGSREVPPAP